jgi:PAS domain S-box-containing protein
MATFEHDLPAVDHAAPGTALVTLAPIRDTAHRLLYVFAQVQDISQQRGAEEGLRRSEERFRLLVHGVTEYAIFLLGVDGRVASWNAGAERIKGYAADEIIGSYFGVFYTPEDQESGHPEANLETALRDGQLAEEGWRVRRDGTRFWASVVISPVFGDRGDHQGFVKVTRDRTDQRRHEQERQELIIQQTEVLALTAHELRNPAAVIDGSARLLLSSWSDLPPEDRDEMLHGVRAGAQRLHRLAGDLIAASRLHAETLDLEPTAILVRDLLLEAVARAGNLHPGAAIELRAPTGLVVQADAIRLGQSLDNLLDNALRHGLPPVTVTAEMDDLSLRITVSDAGVGIPADLAPRLFERFATGSPRRSTGLGLYLVRQVARRHGGDAAYVAPDADHETSFVITLPRGA